jgi:hypothetical protein
VFFTFILVTLMTSRLDRIEDKLDKIVPTEEIAVEEVHEGSHVIWIGEPTITTGEDTKHD